MDRSHTMVRMQQGALKMAIPTEVFKDLVHQADQQAFSELISSDQRQLRVESLLWSHIWPNHPFPSDQDLMLERSGRHNNQEMTFSAKDPAQPLASTSQPRMGEFRYCPTPNQSRFPPSKGMPHAFPIAHANTPQHYPYLERSNGFPFSNQRVAICPPASISHTLIRNAGAFHPSSQLLESFHSHSILPPIGTGRPLLSTIYEDYHPFQTTEGVSNRKCFRVLKPFDTYAGLFSEALTESQPLEFVQQQRVNYANKAHPVDVWLKRQASTTYSWPRPDIPPQMLGNVSNQSIFPIRSRSQTRKGSLPTRRDSQAELRDTLNKSGDTTIPHGIFKKRRSSVPRKAAVAACAAMARVNRMDLELESDEANFKSPKRSWAQVVSNTIKEGETEQNVALNDVSPKASSPTKEVKIEQGDNQTSAQMTGRSWHETQAEQQNMRASSFGQHQLPGTSKNGRLFMKTKFDSEDMTGKSMQDPKGAFDHGWLAIRTKKPPIHSESQKQRVSFSQSPKVAKDVKH